MPRKLIKDIRARKVLTILLVGTASFLIVEPIKNYVNVIGLSYLQMIILAVVLIVIAVSLLGKKKGSW